MRNENAKRPMMSQRPEDVICILQAIPAENGFEFTEPKFVRRDEANLMPPTAALAYGRTCFGGMRIRRNKHGKPYVHYAKTHWRRLRFSGKAMGILHSSARPNFPHFGYKYEELTAIVLKLHEINGEDFNYCRPTLYKDGGGLGVMSVEQCGFTLIIELVPFNDGDYYGKMGNDGMRIVIVNPRVFSRPNHPSQTKAAKSGGISTYVVGGDAKEWAHANGGYDDALMQSYQNSKFVISDLSSSNIGFIKGKTVVFPLLDEKCLNGIQNQIFGNIARDLGYSIEYRDVFVEELSSFSECFCTGTAGGFTRISSITSYGGEMNFEFASHDIFDAIHAEFKRQIAEEIEYDIQKMF